MAHTQAPPPVPPPSQNEADGKKYYSVTGHTLLTTLAGGVTDSFVLSHATMHNAQPQGSEQTHQSHVYTIT